MDFFEHNESADALDARVDGLLRRRPAEASGDFTARTLARLRRAEAEREAALDRLLRRQPVSVRPGFAERVVERIAAEEVPARRIPSFRARGWWSPVAAAAALLFISIGFLATPEPAPVAYETAFAAETGPTLGEIAADPAIDPDMARLFVLAEGLGSEARVLLDNPDVSSWLAMAD